MKLIKGILLGIVVLSTSQVTAKADVDAPQVDGATAVHWAVYRDDLAAIDLLIKAGAKIGHDSVRRKK